MRFTISLLLLFISISSQAQKEMPDTIRATPPDKTETTTTGKDSLPYATLYFYRSYIPVMKATVKKAWVYINDSLVCKLKANNIFGIKVWQQGKYVVAVDKKGETDITVNVKFGKEYYFECEPKKGLVFGSPTIELVTPAAGKEAAALLKSN